MSVIGPPSRRGDEPSSRVEDRAEPVPVEPSPIPSEAEPAEAILAVLSARGDLAELEAAVAPAVSAEGAVSGPRERFRQVRDRLAESGLNPREVDGLHVEIERLRAEIQAHPRTAPADLAEDLLMLYDFYSGYDTNRADTISLELRALRDQRLRPNLALRGGEASFAQVEEARLAVRISRMLGHEAGMTTDLRRWADLLQHLPFDALNARGSAEQIAAMLQDWIAVRDRFHGEETGTSLHGVPIPMSRSEVMTTMRGLRERLLDYLRGAEIPEAELTAISTQITQAIEFNDPEAAARLHVETLLEMAPQYVEWNRQIEEAEALADPEQRRTALLSLLRAVSSDGNEHTLRVIREALLGTLPEDSSAEQGFLLLISEASVLQNFDSYQFTALRSEARALLAETMGSSDLSIRERGETLIAAHALFTMIEDETGLARLLPALGDARGAAMMALVEGETPLDSSERVALASLAVQVDQILLPSRLEEVARAEARTEISAAAPVLGATLLISLDTLRHEIERGVEGRPWLNEPGDLPMPERLEACRLLARSLSQFQSLTRGENPPITRDAFEERVAALEALFHPVFSEMFPSGTGDAEADAMSENIVYDLRTRLHAALLEGDTAWTTSSLSAEGIAEFAAYSEMAHDTLSGWDDPPTAQQIEQHLGAAAIFARIGLEDRVRAALRPIRTHAYGIEDIAQRFSLTQELIPFYQQAGMTTEGNAVLNELAELAGRDGATEEMRQFAEVIPALREANAGHLDRAHELLEALPDNPVAAATLEQMQDGVRTERLTQLTAVWSAGIQDYLATRRGEGLELVIHEMAGTVDEAMLTRIERSLTTALQQAVAAVQRGDFTSIYAAMAASDNADVRTFLYEEFPYASLLESLSDPEMSREDFARGVLGLARSFGEEERYALAGNLASMVLEDGPIGAEARAFIADLEWEPYLDQAPQAAAMLLLSFVGGPEIFALYASATFLLDPDEGSAYLGLAENAIALATFGAGEIAAARAARYFVGTGVARAMSPLALRTATWGVRSFASAGAFVPMGMASSAFFGWSTEGLTAENFATQFGAMLVVFAVCHGATMGAARFGGALEGVPWLRASGRLATGASRLNWAGRGIVGVTGYGATIAGLAGTEYLNEALGLHHDESAAFYESLGLPAPTESAPFFLRVLRSAIMDAHMRFMGRTANSVTGGMIERMGVEVEGRLRFLEAQRRFVTTVERLGFEPRSAEGQRVLEALVGRAVAGERFEDIEASMSERGEIRRDVDRALRMVLEVNPESPRGRRLSALLIAYRQAHPELRLAEEVGQIEHQIRQIVRRMGTRGAAAATLRNALLENFLSRNLRSSEVRDAYRTMEAVLAENGADAVTGTEARPARSAAVRAREELQRLTGLLRQIFSESPTSTAITAAATALFSAGLATGSSIATVLGIWGISWGSTAMLNERTRSVAREMGQDFLHFVETLPATLRDQLTTMIREIRSGGSEPEPAEESLEGEALPARREIAAPPEPRTEVASPDESGVRERPVESEGSEEMGEAEVTRRAGYEDPTRVVRRPRGELGNEEVTAVPGARGEETRVGEADLETRRAARGESEAEPESFSIAVPGMERTSTRPVSEEAGEQFEMLDQILTLARLTGEHSDPLVGILRGLINDGSLVLDTSTRSLVFRLFNPSSPANYCINRLRAEERIGIREALLWEVLQGRGPELMRFFENFRDRHEAASRSGDRDAAREVLVEARDRLRGRFARFAELPEMAAAVAALPEAPRRDGLPAVASDIPGHLTLDTYTFTTGTELSATSWSRERRRLEMFADPGMPAGPLVNLARRARGALQIVYERAREIQALRAEHPDSPRIAEAEAELTSARRIVRQWEAAHSTVEAALRAGESSVASPLHGAFRQIRSALSAPPLEEGREVTAMGRVRPMIESIESEVPDAIELADAWLDPARGDQGVNPLEAGTLTFVVNSSRGAVDAVSRAIVATLRGADSGTITALNTLSDGSIRMVFHIPDHPSEQIVIRVVTAVRARAESSESWASFEAAARFEAEETPIPRLRGAATERETIPPPGRSRARVVVAPPPSEEATRTPSRSRVRSTGSPPPEEVVGATGTSDTPVAAEPPPEPPREVGATVRPGRGAPPPPEAPSAVEGPSEVGAPSITDPARRGVARFRPVTEIVAEAERIAGGLRRGEDPNSERVRTRVERYRDHLISRGMEPEEAASRAEAWRDSVLAGARRHHAGRTNIYDFFLPVRPETAHLDAATVDHHGRFANERNATEQLLDRFNAALEAVSADPAALEAARRDRNAMEAALEGTGRTLETATEEDVRVAAAIRRLNIREVTTDNLADGGWCIWIARNQARVLRDPALRELIEDATHFEDFTAFGTEYAEDVPGVRLQAALFQAYGEILRSHGIRGSDRFSPSQATAVMGEALSVIDRLLSDPAHREDQAALFFTEVERARAIAAERGVIAEGSVHEGDTNLTFFDLTTLGEFTVFQQWLALPRVEAVPGTPDTLQVSVVPMPAITNAAGESVSRRLTIVAIPNGRELPSGRGLTSILERINAAERARAAELGIEPANFWFGKNNVILPNPAGGGTVLRPEEISAILLEAGLFERTPAEAPIPEAGSEAAPIPLLPTEAPSFMGFEVSDSFASGMALLLGGTAPEPFVDFAVEGARVALRERNYARDDVPGFEGFRHIPDRHAAVSGDRGEIRAGRYSSDVDIEAIGRETLRNYDRIALTFDDQGRPIFMFQRTFDRPIGTSTGGEEVFTNQVILSYDGEVTTSFPCGAGRRGWVARSAIEAGAESPEVLLSRESTSPEIETRHAPFLPMNPTAEPRHIYLAEVIPVSTVNTRTVAVFRAEAELRAGGTTRYPWVTNGGTTAEPVTVMVPEGRGRNRRLVPTEVMMAEMRFAVPVGEREEIGPDGETHRVSLFINRTYFRMRGGSVEILGGYPIAEHGEAHLPEEIWNPAVRGAAREAPVEAAPEPGRVVPIGGRRRRGAPPPVEERLPLAASEAPPPPPEPVVPPVAAAEPPPLRAPAERAPRAVRRAYEIAGSASPLAAHARRIYEEISALTSESPRHAELLAEATTLSEIANAAELNPGPESGAMHDDAVRYRDLAQTILEALRDLEPGSEAYRDAIEDYQYRRDIIGAGLIAEYDAPMNEVLNFLRGLEGDRVSWTRARRRFPHLEATEAPTLAEGIEGGPVTGRPKDTADILAKLDRRGLSSLDTMTDFAGTRVVVENYEDVLSTLAMIQTRFTIRGLRDAEGNPILDSNGEPVRDRDGIRRLIAGEGRPYRAMHVVVEVNGRAVEIQIQTHALHEWYRLEHDLLYENHDLSPAVRPPLEEFFRESAQFLADVEQGAAYREPPDHNALLESIPADVPPEIRLQIESSILQLAELMRETARRHETREAAETGMDIPEVAAVEEAPIPEAELPVAAADSRPPPAEPVGPVAEVRGPRSLDPFTAAELPGFAAATDQRPPSSLPSAVVRSHLAPILARSEASGLEFASLAIEVNGTLVTTGENFATSHSTRHVSGEDQYLLFHNAAIDLEIETDLPRDGSIRIFALHTHPSRESASGLTRSPNEVHEDGRPFTLTNDADWRAYRELFQIYVRELRARGFTGPIELVAGAAPTGVRAEHGTVDPTLAREPYVATTTLHVEAGEFYGEIATAEAEAPALPEGAARFEGRFTDEAEVGGTGNLVALESGAEPPSGRERWEVIATHGDTVTLRNASGEVRHFTGRAETDAPFAAGTAVYFMPPLPHVSGEPPPLSPGAEALTFRMLEDGSYECVLGRGGTGHAVDFAISERTLSRRQAILRWYSNGFLTAESAVSRPETGIWISRPAPGAPEGAPRPWQRVSGTEILAIGDLIALGNPRDPIVFQVGLENSVVTLTRSGSTVPFDLPAPARVESSSVGTAETVELPRGSDGNYYTLVYQEGPITRFGMNELATVSGGRRLADGRVELEIRVTGQITGTPTRRVLVTMSAAQAEELQLRFNADGRLDRAHSPRELSAVLQAIPPEDLLPPEAPPPPEPEPAVITSRSVVVGEAPPLPLALETAVPFAAEPIRGIDPGTLPVGRWRPFRFTSEGRAVRPPTGEEVGSHAMMRDAEGRIHLRVGAEGGGEISAVNTSLVVPDADGVPRSSPDPIAAGEEIILGSPPYGTQILLTFGRGRRTSTHCIELAPRPEAEAVEPSLPVAASEIPGEALPASTPVIFGTEDGTMEPYSVTTRSTATGTVYEFSLDLDPDNIATTAMPHLIRVQVRPGEALNPEFLPTVPEPGTTSLEWNGLRFEYEWPGSAAEPGSSLAPVGSTGITELALMNRVQDTIRRAIRVAAGSRTYRDSPTGMAHLLNNVSVTLTIDAQTGESVTPETARAHPERSYLTFSIGGHADFNRIELSRTDREAIDELLGTPGLSAETRSILEAIRRLDGRPMVETGDPIAALPAEGSAGEILPEISAEQVEEMSRALLGNARLGNMTIAGFGGGFGWSLMPNLTIGAVTLDARGNIVATEVMYPDFMSARGTTYRTGIVAGGTRVPIVNSGRTLLHYEAEGLTPWQEAALFALMNSPGNRSAREEYLAGHPYAVEMAVHRGLGDLVIDLSRNVSVLPGAGPQALALREVGGEWSFASWREGDPRPDGTLAIVRFTELEPRYSAEGGIRPGRFRYTVEGDMPAPVAGMLEWARYRIEDRGPGEF